MHLSRVDHAQKLHNRRCNAQNSTAGRVIAKPEKRRRSVPFEDEVSKQGKLGKKTKMTHNPIQGPRIQHVRPSEARLAALPTALRKRGGCEPSDCDDSGVGGAICCGKVVGGEIREGYDTPGIPLEFVSSDDEDDEEFAPPSKEEGGRFRGL